MRSRAIVLIALGAATAITASTTACGRGARRDPGGTGSGQPEPVASSSRLAHPERAIKVGLWLGMPNNEIMTPAMIDWIGQHASIVVLNAEAKGPVPYFDYDASVARFKQAFPAMPVLFYDTALRAHKTSRVGGGDFDAVAKSSWLLRKPTGEPVIQRGNRAMIDVTNPEYQAYLPKTVAANVQASGTDGIAFDGYHRNLIRSRVTTDLYQNGRALAAQWPAAASKLLGAVKSALRDRLVVFNGLWPMADELPSQAELLEVADGASVEFFGYDAREPPAGREQEFQRHVLAVQAVMKANPKKLYLVFGRTRRATYLDYAVDYQTQRYDLAAYLLGMTPHSTFKYHAHFQTIAMAPDRADGLSYYADWDLDIGAPVGEMTVADGVYRRVFTKAVVLVAPAWLGDRTAALDGTYYTPEGETRTGTLALPAGTGAILLTARPAARATRVIVDDFEAGDPGEWRFPVGDDATVIASEAGNHFVQLRGTADAVQPYHERRLQPIRRLDPYTRLSLRVRSTDPAGSILVRVEVDDTTPLPPDDTAGTSPPADPAGDDDDDSTALGHGPRNAPNAATDDEPGDGDDDVDRAQAPLRGLEATKARARRARRGPQPYAVIVVNPRDGRHRARPRGRDIPFGVLRARGAVPFVTAPDGYVSDGRWQTVTIDAAAILRDLAPHLTARRVSEVRVLGDADLDDVVLADP